VESLAIVIIVLFLIALLAGPLSIAISSQFVKSRMETKGIAGNRDIESASQICSFNTCCFWKLDRCSILVDFRLATISSSYWAFLDSYLLHRASTRVLFRVFLHARFVRQVWRISQEWSLIGRRWAWARRPALNKLWRFCAKALNHRT
jgi:hypothetical protein